MEEKNESTVQQLYQKVELPFLKAVTKKKNRTRFINKPIVISNKQ